MKNVAIHMASTFPRHDELGVTVYDVVCRCGWQSTDHLRRSAARAAGDAHLKVANA